MALPLKNLAVRLPSTQPFSIARSAAHGTIFTAARQTCLAARPSTYEPIAAPRTFVRRNHDLSQASRRELDAGANQNATILESKPASRSHESAVAAGLDWDTFFKLRVKRRRIQLVFSAASGVMGGGLAAVVLSSGLAEPLVAQVPLDPFATLGIMTMACIGLGWLAGPSIGSQVFYLLERKHKAAMQLKEGQFFARIKKNRVDPTNSNASNPVPDFYGEKIQSVAGYRRWLKDQRAFNKKKTANFV